MLYTSKYRYIRLGDGEVCFKDHAFETENPRFIEIIETNPEYLNGNIKKNPNGKISPPPVKIDAILGVTTSTNAVIPTGEPEPAEFNVSFVDQQLGKRKAGRPKGSQNRNKE